MSVRPAFTVILAGLMAACGGRPSDPKASPAGEETHTDTKALKAGAAMLQDVGPVKEINVYLVGFHPMKDDPGRQMEAHHFCRQVNEDFAQCVLYDGNTETSNLNGIEYIISETLFEGLPGEEKQFWHPHNYEILSGQLVAPGLPDVAEKELMRKKVNSYGKTWHVWNTGHHGTTGDKLPLGEPMLAWSFNADGEAAPGLVEQMAQRMKMDVTAKRRDRADLASLARPQEGVDALAGRLQRTGQPPGVTDKRGGRTAAAPTPGSPSPR
jgi:hypothetical protein